MATVALDPSVGAPPRTIVRRPTATTGFTSWITTVDHKKIGLMYIIAAFGFGVVGGVEALLIRLQLATPDGSVLSSDAYQQAFTMHGTTMIFLMVMPVSTGLGNYLVPLQIGARDVAFPRINAFGFWVFLSGGLFLYSSMFLGGMADGGWFGYAPLSSGMTDPAVSGVEVPFLPGNGMSFWAIGLIITGIGSIAGAVNFVVTIINMRAPGMNLMRMPVFTWMIFVISFMLVFAMPVITVALIQMFFDREFGGKFFEPGAGGDPLMWQHMFWMFGHPEVYILILPAMGVVSEVLPVFARKPLFGYSFVVFSGAAIGFMGWGVWAHHMFATGIGPVAVTAFALSTMFIAVPTGVKIFNWLGTFWGGSIAFKTPMLFSLAFIAMFVIGGLSGVTHAIAPADRQQTDTYYIVAHFHYVLFGGAVFGIMAAAYYWFPKMFGVLLDERLGKVHFWLQLIGFNLAFGPMHVLGLQGQPRRTYTYPDGMGWSFWNLVSTIGAFTIALGILVFGINWVLSVRRGIPAGDDPWDARTLEWSIPSPPPPHNFDVVPVVENRDEWWHQKYTEDDEGRMLRRISGAADEPGADPGGGDAGAPAGGSGVTTLEKTGAEPSGPEPSGPEEAGDGGGHDDHHGDEVHEHIHMPSPSYHPFVVALGIPMIGYGLINHWWWFIPGAVLTGFGLLSWALEPDAEPEESGPDGGGTS